MPSPMHPSDRIRRLACATAAVLLLSASPSGASGYGAQDALGRDEGPRVRAARDRVHAAEADLDAALRGVRWELVAEPGIAFGADVEDSAELVPSLAVGMDLEWQYDDVGILAKRIVLHKAETGLRDARRIEIEEALELLAAHLRAELALGAAERALEENRARWEQAREADAPSVYAEIGVRAAQLDLREERAKVSALERAAADAGLAGPPQAVLARFETAEVAAERTPQHALLRLELERAHAQWARGQAFGPLRRVDLAARYESRTHRYQLDARVGVDGGRPQAALGAEYRPQQDDQWSVGVSARFAWDETSMAREAAVLQAVEAARDALDAYAIGFGADLADAARTVGSAEERVRLAAATWRARRDEALALAAEGRDATRTEARATRDLDRVYLEWHRYVNAVARFLDLTGGEWRIVGTLETLPRTGE